MGSIVSIATTTILVYHALDANTSTADKETFYGVAFLTSAITLASLSKYKSLQLHEQSEDDGTDPPPRDGGMGVEPKGPPPTPAPGGVDPSTDDDTFNIDEIYDYLQNIEPVSV